MVLCLAWAGLVSLVLLLDTPSWLAEQLARQELATVDLRFNWRGAQPPAPEIVILAIDQKSLAADACFERELLANPELAKLAAWPYPRSVYATALDRLFTAGARAVAIDLLFLAPREDDESFRAALARHGEHTVLACNFTDDGHQLMLPLCVAPTNLPTAAVAGFDNYWPDADHCVRSMLQCTTLSQVAGVAPSVQESAIGSFAWLAASKMGVQHADRTAELIHFAGPATTFPMHPFYEIFDPQAWAHNLKNGEYLRDKLVLIGPASNFQHDQHLTPFGPMDGVEIHANAIATWLQDNAPRVAPSWLGWLLIGVLALLTAMLLNTSAHPLLKITYLCLLAGAYFAGTATIFIRAGVVWPVTAQLWTVAGGAVLGIVLQVTVERVERMRVRRALDRYVSHQVAEEILRHGSEYAQSLGGQRRAVTVLFSDIRGFTSMSEQADPLVLVQQLNEYLSAMVEVVMAHNGTLDKFIGDAIMAVYGAPLSDGPVQDAWRAVQTALDMRAKLTELQQKWAAEGRPVLRIGIGLNHGEVIVGNIGSPRRMEYTVIGDTVNVASRVEGLTKALGCDILITETVHALVADRVVDRELIETSVKGRAQKLTVFALDALRT